MGLLLNDVIFIMKVRQNCPENINIFTLGSPTSHILNEDIKFLISRKVLNKIGIDHKIVDNFYLKQLSEKPNNEKITFDFFTKLIKIKKYFSIDINKRTKPTFCVDITKKISRKFINKADLIYDTGSLSYTLSHLDALGFLNKLLKKNGTIIHQSANNGSSNTGYCQINKSFFDFYYKKYEKILIGYGFCDNFLNSLKKKRTSSRIIHLVSNPSINELNNKKNYLYYAVKKKYYAVKKKKETASQQFYFYSDNKVFRKYFKSLRFFSKIK
jgi:hypothetical protein